MPNGKICRLMYSYTNLYECVGDSWGLTEFRMQGRRQDFRRGGGAEGGVCRDLPKKLTIQTSARLS